MPFARAQFGQMERKVRQPNNEGCRIKNREVSKQLTGMDAPAGSGEEQGWRWAGTSLCSRPQAMHSH